YYFTLPYPTPPSILLFTRYVALRDLHSFPTRRSSDLYRPVFSTMTPCSARYFVTIDAGMPVLANLPETSSPGVITVALIGSSMRSEEHTSELQSPCNLVCRLLLEKKKKNTSKS